MTLLMQIIGGIVLFILLFIIFLTIIMSSRMFKDDKKYNGVPFIFSFLITLSIILLKYLP